MMLKCFSIFIIMIGANCQTPIRSLTNKIYIGASVMAWHLSEANYSKTLAKEFSSLTPEYEMKWGYIEKTCGQINYTRADQLVKFGLKNNMTIRGHTLLWHEHLPTWLDRLNKTDLQMAMVKHITNTVTHFKGKLYCWDVVNEIFNENGTYRDTIWYKNFGIDFVALAFKTAHAADPSVKLYINDYSVEGKNKKSDALYNLVKNLKSVGVPVDGVGFQSHFVGDKIPRDLKLNLQRFVDLGVEVAITELDIREHIPTNAQIQEQQAKDFATVFKACVAVSKCVGVTVWEVTDKYSWIPRTYSGYGEALLIDSNYKVKTAIKNAIQSVLK